MSDFKFSDEPLSYGGRKNKGNGVDKKFIIIIVASLLIGIIVFIIAFALFGPKKQVKPAEPPVTTTTLSIDSEIAKGLYAYIYNSHTKEDDKYIKEKYVTLDSFTNYEKFYYALYFASSNDLVEVPEEENEEKKNLYTIDYATVKGYIASYFGPDVTFSNNSNILYTFPFAKNGYNTGTFYYDTARDIFMVELNQNKENTESIVPSFLRGLSTASQSSDGEITLTENIVYLSSEKKDDKYHIQFYQDYDKTVLLEEIDKTEKELEEEPLDLETYSSVANSITYTFKQDTAGNIYFYSSKIKDQDIRPFFIVFFGKNYYTYNRG